MESTENLNERISPDCLSSSSNSSSSAISTITTTISFANSPPTNTHGINLQPIPEVPSESYEYVVEHNGEVKILCKICQYISNKKSNFKRHFATMHFVHKEDTPQMLECCGTRFATRGDKYQHIKSVHKSGYKCTTCSKVFDRPALLERHVSKHTGKKPFKCSLCVYQTPNKANARRHIAKRHSDVPEGTILFVTPNGEEIKVEVVTNRPSIIDVEHISSPDSSPSPSTQSTTAVVKSSADSTSFGSIVDASFHDNSVEPSLASSLNIPRSSSPSISSSSLSPPNHQFAGAMSVFGATMLTEDNENGQDKKEIISHSIDAIMQDTESHFIPCETTTSDSTPCTDACCTPETFDEPNYASMPSQEHLDSVNYSNGYNHPNINEPQMESYCLPNWPLSSSLFPINNDYTTTSPFHQTSFLPPSSPSIVFRQCAHGCWHHVDNQEASTFTEFARDTSSSFVPTNFFPYQTPDLRSYSYSMHQQTENSSMVSSKNEDDNDIIDVVGNDDGDNDRSKKSQLVSSICEGFDSLSTAEISSPVGIGQPGECKITHFDSQPVESAASQRSSFSSSSGSDKDELDSDSRCTYVPKKLRVARGHTHYNN